MEIKNNIRVLRAEKGLSQERLAKQVHVTQTAVSSWELGNSYPDMQTAIKLSNFFEVSLDYLVGLTDEKQARHSTNNVQASTLMQESNSITIDSDVKITKEEVAILHTYRLLDVRGRARLMNAVFDLEDEYKNHE